mgnify:CR=1 FL=1
MTVKEILKNHDIKYSTQREKIVEILRDSPLPMTINQLYKTLNQDEQNVDLSTIYRNLDTLAEKGLALKTTHMDNDESTYEFNRHEHRHYLICQECKAIEIIEGCPMHDFESEVEKSSNYVITGHRLELYGICPSCQAKRLKSSSSITGQ